MANTNKVLLIVSNEYNKYLNQELDLSLKSGYINLSNYTIEYIVDPSRQELEKKLIETEYVCVIPCTLYCLKIVNAEIYQTFSFNVCDLLNKKNVDFLGNNYITNLILNDKISYLKTSKYGLPSKILTRYQFLNNHELKTLSLFDDLPCIIEPLYYKDYISSKKYLINTRDNVIEKITQIFHTHIESEELIVYKYIPHVNEIVVSIIGTPPYSNTLIYMSNSQENNFSVDKLLVESYRLFELYAFKDFAQFKYLYSPNDGKCYLSEINCSNCLNKYILESAKEKYCLNFEEVLNLILVSYLSKKTLTSEYESLIYKLIHILPKELVNNILPLNLRTKLNIEIDYRHVCKEINNNFLKPDESNKFRILTQLCEALDHIPTLTHTESPFLGVKCANHEFLNNYQYLPKQPQNPQKILNASVEILNGQMRWHSPTMLNNIDPPIMFNTIAASAITNLYNPSTMEHSSSAGYLKMENQIVQQMSTLIGWNPEKATGVFTSGGKNCLTYAIKCGLNRCREKTDYNSSPVVITSEINHYSIESSCYQLGMEKSDCIRIPVNSDGILDFEVFEKVVFEKLINKVPIACIIFSGGNTTHCFVENIKKGVEIIQRLVKQHGTKYNPYIYYDLVVCWPWLFFKEYDFRNNQLKIPEHILKKIYTVTNIIKHSYFADGIGIDFHKLGFAPLQNSLFMSKNSNDLYLLMQNKIDPDFREPYHYTFCNSRGATHIISAWNVLQSLGVQGFQSYIANMIMVTETLGKELVKFNFEILNTNGTFGFATILWTTYEITRMRFDTFICKNDNIILKNNQYLYQLTEYLKKNHEPGYFLRFLPNYIILKNGIKVATLSVFPTNLNINEEKAKIIAKGIGEIKLNFDKLYPLLFSEQNGKIPDEIPK